MQQADVEKFRIYMRAWKGYCDAFCLGTMPKSGWFTRQTHRKMRFLIGDNIPLTLTNNNVENNERPAASKGICAQWQESIYGDEIHTKVNVLNNKLKEKCANCNAFICKKIYHSYVVCGKCI